MSCECEFLPGAGFGSGPFGEMPFGSGTPEDGLAITGAVLIAANLAAVAYAGDPGLPNPGNTSGPLWPPNWVLVSDEPGATIRLTQFVLLIPDELTRRAFTDDYPVIATLALPFFLVWFDGNLSPGLPYELVLSIEDTTITGCECAEFVGLTLRKDTRQTDARDGEQLQDLANPFSARDVLLLPPVLGSYQLTDTGDFGLDRSDDAGRRKRIERRVTSAVGAFFHLQDYGAKPKIKGLLTVDAAERIQARVRAQVLQEPDIVDVSVRVLPVQGNPNVLSVAILAVPDSGEPVSLVVAVDFG